MGLVRLLLALSVVLTHCNGIMGFHFISGDTAVQAFFIISGFYMSLIWNEKYNKKQKAYQLFISNRFLRLYPAYWVVLIITLFSSLLVYIYSGGQQSGRLHAFLEYSNNLNPASLLFLVFTNIVVFFQDLLMFLGLNSQSGNFFFTPDYSGTQPYVFHFLLIPQAWSIGLELVFYIIAPFLVGKRLRILIMAIIGSLGLRFFLYAAGYSHDPWTCRFFPTELVFFLCGAVSYRFYKAFGHRDSINRIQIVFFVLVVLYTVLYTLVDFPFKKGVYLLLITFAIPFIFKFSKTSSIDAYLGDLSYPVYISHIFVLNVLAAIGLSSSIYFSIYLIINTILFSVIIYLLIIKRMEKYRQQRLQQ